MQSNRRATATNNQLRTDGGEDEPETFEHVTLIEANNDDTQMVLLGDQGADTQEVVEIIDGSAVYARRYYEPVETVASILDNARPTIVDGQPAIEFGTGEVLMLRTVVRVESEAEGKIDEYVDTKTELDHDDGQSWWDVTEENSEGTPYPWITIQPEVDQ